MPPRLTAIIHRIIAVRCGEYRVYLINFSFFRNMLLLDFGGGHHLNLLKTVKLSAKKLAKNELLQIVFMKWTFLDA